MNSIKKYIITYFFITGISAHIALIVAISFALNYFQLTPRQFISKAIEKSGLELTWVDKVIRPSSRFAHHILDGQLLKSHPRILLPQLSNWSGQGSSTYISNRSNQHGIQTLKKASPCSGGGILGLTACWLSNSNEKNFSKLAQAIKSFQVETPDATGKYGNGWEIAFAYDFISLSPSFKDEDRELTENKILAALKDYLALLDDEGPSLWHGRSSLASMAWLCASVLDGDNPKHQPFVAQAQGHFLDTVRAIELTEAWPEGYNYWINSRGFTVTLALSAYVNALDNAQHKKRILAVAERIGLWHLYATRPDDRIEGIADEGPRVDLKDESRRVIDILAQLTRNPLFATYSNYLGQLHGKASYYRDYRWGFLLFNDPTIEKLNGKNTFLESFKYHLPNAELFGRKAMGLAFLRSGWKKDDTFISFHAGSNLTHHGHYDAGHFTLFKGNPLAINSSVYGDYLGENRLNYSIRTIAKNSLLILRPDEEVKPNRFFKTNVSAGGQRITLPTGSTIHSTKHWYENLKSDQHLAGGKVENFEHNFKAGYSYISADLTAAYNSTEFDENGDGGKVSKVLRSLLYLEDEDRLFVFDQIAATDPSYTKKWLLHSVKQPKTSGLTLLKGNLKNGISQTTSNEVSITNGNGKLNVFRHLPVDGITRLVGGPDYQYYVETDGDDSDLDGDNFNQGAVDKPWFDIGMWRIEIQPQVAKLEDEFLIELLPSLKGHRSDVSTIIKSIGKTKTVKTDNMLVGFISQKQGSFELKIPSKTEQVLLVGFQSNSPITWNLSDESTSMTASEEGVLFLNKHLDEGSILKVSW